MQADIIGALNLHKIARRFSEPPHMRPGRTPAPNPDKTHDMKSIQNDSCESVGHSVLDLTADEADLLEPPRLRPMSRDLSR
jgi:hypothetical protein